MKLDDYLAATAPQTRNKSHVAILLDALAGTSIRDDILAALRSNHEAAHLGRALTKIAHEVGALPTDKCVAAQAVRDWRAANGPR
jgi:hypothetical protein